MIFIFLFYVFYSYYFLKVRFFFRNFDLALLLSFLFPPFLSPFLSLLNSFFLFYFSNSAKPQFKMQNAKSVLWSFGFKLINQSPPPPPSSWIFFCHPLRKARGLYYIDGVLGRRGPYIGGSNFKQYAGKMQKKSTEAKAEAPGYWILPPGIEQKIMSINHLRRPASWRSVYNESVTCEG